MSDTDEDLPDLSNHKPPIATISREIFDLLIESPGTWIDMKDIQIRMKKQGLSQAVSNTITMLRNKYYLDIERKSFSCYNYRLIADNRGRESKVYVEK